MMESRSSERPLEFFALVTASTIALLAELTQLPMDALINNLSADDLHALVGKALLQAFAAEDKARMEATSYDPSASGEYV